MLTLGLLWYDDDARRPVPQKIAEAVARYHERVGGRPTVCQLNPRQAAALASVKTAALPQLRLVPDETLRSNYFLVGIEDSVESQPAGPLDDAPVPEAGGASSRRSKRSGGSAPQRESAGTARPPRVPEHGPRARRLPSSPAAPAATVTDVPAAAGAAPSTPTAPSRRPRARDAASQQAQIPARRTRARRQLSSVGKSDGAAGAGRTPVTAPTTGKPSMPASATAKGTSITASPRVSPAERRQRRTPVQSNLVQLEMPLADASQPQPASPRRRRAS